MFVKMVFTINIFFFCILREKSFDLRLKSDLSELYYTLYGLGKPKCIHIAAQVSNKLKMQNKNKNFFFF
jgi:hypothetical protein